MHSVMSWAPGALLVIGCALTISAGRQEKVAPRQPLASIVIPDEGLRTRDIVIGEDERRVAGMDHYVLREFGDSLQPAFTMYVGYYESQSQGHTIHSPKNCLPGAGWEPLQQLRISIPVGRDSVPVNKYVIANKGAKAVVLYWYQGRNRVEANEWKVKFDLMRDAALHGRTEEALVRIVVPVTPRLPEEQAFALAVRKAQSLVPAVDRALPSL